MGRRQTAPGASVWPVGGQELPPKGPVVMYKLCPFSFLLCPLSGFGMHRDSLGRTGIHCVQWREEYKAQRSWPTSSWTCCFLRKGWAGEPMGAFGHIEAQFLAPTCHEWRVEWAPDEGKHSVHLC